MEAATSHRNGVPRLVGGATSNGGAGHHAGGGATTGMMDQRATSESAGSLHSQHSMDSSECLEFLNGMDFNAEPQSPGLPLGILPVRPSFDADADSSGTPSPSAIDD